MNRNEVVTQIQNELGDRIRELQRPLDKRLNVYVDSDAITDSSDILHNQLMGRLQTASAVDAPRHIEILYHWAFDTVGMIVTLRTRIERESPQIASITSVCPSAHWIEREMWELMGITFNGHPDLRHLLLDDDWPEGKYPLRRDYRKE